MLFTQIEFYFFLAFVLIFLLAIRHHRAQKIFLLLASYYFYAYWDWRFVGLLGLSTGIDFTIGQLLKRAERPRARKVLIVLSVIVNLGILGFFKYFNFFIGSMQALLAPLGWHVQTLSIILPVGVSFYTFQSLSYTIDVYRRHMRACDDLLDYALYVAFFPQLFAGPIMRAITFLPQLSSLRPITWAGAYSGARQFIYGLFKKAVIADTLAKYVDITFSNPGMFDCGTTWLSVLAYSVQIYCDFSGYSDMAIGAARILGYDLMENFRHPYLSTSIEDFWRRWHISLSSWLRDYLYIPLGGNRKGSARTYLNLFLTMLLGGLWHGAAWTFVFWGGWHGAALGINKFWRERRPPRWAQAAGAPATRMLGWFVTMGVVAIGWVFFRAHGFHDAVLILRQMFNPAWGISWLSPVALVMIGLMVLRHLAVALIPDRLPALAANCWYSPVFLVLILWTVLLFRPKGFTAFIYFQF